RTRARGLKKARVTTAYPAGALLTFDRQNGVGARRHPRRFTDDASRRGRLSRCSSGGSGVPRVSQPPCPRRSAVFVPRSDAESLRFVLFTRKGPSSVVSRSLLF